MICYLEQNANISDSVFNNEVNSLEFVQIIGDMNITHLKDYKKRDLFLRKLGKKLLKKFKQNKPRKTNKLYIEIRHETRILSTEEIDSLLTVVDEKIKLLDKIKREIKWFWGNCSEWKIIISKNNIYYKFSLIGIEKIDYNKTCTLDIEDIIDGVLSQEEIDMLLTPINNLALKGEVCCLGKVFVSGFNTFLSALKGGVLNPSHTIKKEEK